MKNRLKRLQLTIRNFNKKGIIFGATFALTLLSLSVLIPKLSIHADPVDSETIFEADARIGEPLAGISPDFNVAATDSDKYSVSIDSWYLYENPYPDVTTDDVFEEGKDYALRVVFTPNDGYTFRDDTIFTVNGKATSCYGANFNREIIFYNVFSEPEEPRFDVTYDFNGGAKDGAGSYAVQMVSFGMMLSEENLIDELGVEAPAGRVLNYVTVNETPYNIGDGFFLDTDTTIKYFWRDDTKTTYAIEFDLNGGTATDYPVPSEVPAGQAFVLNAPDETQVTPPANKEFDAFEVNGERIESGSLITVNNDASVKLLWKDVAAPEPTTTYDTTFEKTETTTEEVARDTDLSAYIADKKAEWQDTEMGYGIGEEYRTAWEALYVAENGIYKYPVYLKTYFTGVTTTDTCFSVDDVILIGDINDMSRCVIYHYRVEYREVNVEVTPVDEAYTILEGADQTIPVASTTDLTVKVDGDLKKVIGIKVDSEWIGEDKCELTSGSTIVTLKADYLATLGPGVHTLAIVYNDGEVSTNFTISADSPNTGVSTASGGSASLAASGAIIAGVLVSTVTFIYLQSKRAK